MRRPPPLAAPLLALALAPVAQDGAGGWLDALAQDEQAGEPEVVLLEDGVTWSGELDLTRTTWADFRVEVPADAVLLRVALESPRVDLDLYGQRGAYIEDSDLADYAALGDSGSERLLIDRFLSPPIGRGDFYFEVQYAYEQLPQWDGELVSRAPFTLRADLFRTRTDAVLEPGVAVRATLVPEEGGFRTFRVDVPEGAPALRVDLYDAGDDLDLLARRRRPVTQLNGAVHQARRTTSRETLLVLPDSTPRLRAGEWYVDVVNMLDQQRRNDFTLLATFAAEPPAELLAIPALPAPRAGPLGRALVGVVEIAAGGGSGSGTVLTPGGLILTAAHVVSDAAGAVLPPDEELVVAASLDERRPPEELFTARVVAVDERVDLALVQVVAGFYGQPLPEGYRFRHVELGAPDELAIGDPLWLVGYPSTGGSASRVSISATRGIVSGFEQAEFGLVVKTDAEITDGNSGGAALDARGRLVAVPSTVIEWGSSQIGYVHPHTLMPAAWRERIARELEPAADEGAPR